MLTSILIAIGLNFDTLSVSIVEGSQAKKKSIITACKVGFVFALGHIIMASIGALLGMGFRMIITSIDHWIAFVLLSAIGAKLIKDSRTRTHYVELESSVNLTLLVPLVIATSIDAIAVGITLPFALKSLSIPITISIIGIVTFILASFGFYFGKKLGSICKDNVKIMGGIMLIGIGVKILIDHVFLGN